MESSNKLYSSLNEVLKHSGTNANLDIYKNLFNNLVFNSKDDNIIFHMFLYFFPFDNCMEQNKDCFWFENYRKEGVFTEYDFAIELLDIFNDYLKIKSTDSFNNRIKLIVEKLGDYKNVRNFVKLINPHADLFVWIVAYLTKDSKYFELISYKENIIPKEFQKDQWIINVGNLLLEKSFNFYYLENAQLIETINSILNKVEIKDKRDQITINKLKDEIQFIKEKEKILEKKLDEEQETNSSMKSELKDLQERVEKIELRDTIKISMIYLYNILHNQFNSSRKKKDMYSDKLDEMLEILKDKRFKKFSFLETFIKDIRFGVIQTLNVEAHSIRKRNLENITKYLQSTCNARLSDVVTFLKKLPNLDLFIELNLIYFKNPAKAEEIFLKIQSYEIAYQEAFE